MINLIATYLVVDWLNLKITNRINKNFAIEAKLKQVILEFIVVDRSNMVDKFNKVDNIKRLLYHNKRYLL